MLNIILFDENPQNLEDIRSHVEAILRAIPCSIYLRPFDFLPKPVSRNRLPALRESFISRSWETNIRAG